MKKTVRDEIALKAMEKIIGTMNDWDLLHTGDYSPEEDTPSHVIAERSYEIADAMLKIRNTGKRSKK